MQTSISLIEGWPEGVQAAWTSRGPGPHTDSYHGFNLGLHVGDDPVRVLANRRVLGETLGAQPVWLDQVHGTDVHHITEPPHASPPKADAAMTQLIGQAACVMAADCLPVLVSSLDGRWVGAAHAGWRGLAAGVLERLLQSMLLAQEDPRRGFRVWLGPCIGPEAFEVGPEVVAAFGLTTAKPSHRAGHFMLDLSGLAEARLQAWAQAQAIPLQIAGLPTDCTFTRADQFYSHRRQAPSGRMAFLIWRKA